MSLMYPLCADGVIILHNVTTLALIYVVLWVLGGVRHLWLIKRVAIAGLHNTIVSVSVTIEVGRRYTSDTSGLS